MAAYQKDYYVTNLARIKARTKEYSQRPEVKNRRKQRRKERLKNPEVRRHINEVQKRYRQRPEVKSRRTAYYHRPEVQERRRTQELARMMEVREAFFDIYGHVCQCPCGCGESNKKLLTMGHLNNDGKEDRLKFRNQHSLFHAAVVNPDTTKYTTLCWNCNCGAQMNGGICPRGQPNKVRRSDSD